jgi:putative acetyltransferase
MMIRMSEFHIQTMSPDAVDEMLAVEREAFGSDEEANLVKELLGDPSTEPWLSLAAYEGKRPVGHCLFTRADLIPSQGLQAYLLGPLAVLPQKQRQGIGSSLVQEGIKRLKELGADWVFVLGHPAYYPRFGFRPALQLGFWPPFPIKEQISDAWMALGLTSSPLMVYQFQVIPARALYNPRYWPT